jgi:ribosomal protein S18
MRYATLAFALLGLAVVLLAADPMIGTWNLNVAKSQYRPGPPPRAATIKYAETADGIKRTGENVDADGNPTSFEYTAKYDGKDYPVTGSDAYDAITLKRINDHTSHATLKKSGKVVSIARRVVSKDGKVMTLTITGTNAKGQKMKNVAVYEKQ